LEIAAGTVRTSSLARKDEGYYTTGVQNLRGSRSMTFFAWPHVYTGLQTSSGVVKF
jgi:hypothetical protein